MKSPFIPRYSCEPKHILPMPEQYYFDDAEMEAYLVEYVDGTMDPSVQAAFEELLDQHPDAAAQVIYLRGLRSALCRLGDQCRCKAPVGFEARLHEELACEMLRERPPLLNDWTPPLHVLTFAVSALLIVLVASTTYTGQAPAVSASAPAKVTHYQTSSRLGLNWTPETASSTNEVARSLKFTQDHPPLPGQHRATVSPALMQSAMRFTPRWHTPQPEASTSLDSLYQTAHASR